VYEMYEDYPIKKSQRNERVDRRHKNKEEFMKVNSGALKSQILPLIAKKAKKP
jgi:hypothetical protein